MAKRIEYIDLAKGICIMLVVLLHIFGVLRILRASLLDKTPIKEPFTKEPKYVADDGHLIQFYLVDTNDVLSIC